MRRVGWLVNSWNEHFDFVVAGSGAGSVVAALVMRRAGKSVLILEKEAVFGGTTARSGGVMWIPNNPLMLADGVEDSPESALTYLDLIAGDFADAPGSTQERRRAFVLQAPEMVKFLIGEGIRFTRQKYWPDYFDELPGASPHGRSIGVEMFDINKLGAWKTKFGPGYISVPARMREALKVSGAAGNWAAKGAMVQIGVRQFLSKISGKRMVTSGLALQARLLQAALQAGVEIRTEAPVREFILQDGRVVGIAAQLSGTMVRIGARLGVLVNAGGFARNQRMREQHMPGTSVEWTLAGHGDTGEILEELIRMGAATAQMSERVGGQVTLPPDNRSDYLPLMQTNISKPHSILLDQHGLRYQNECGSYSTFTRNMLLRDKKIPAVPSWMIFDSQYMRAYMLANTIPGSLRRRRWERTGFLRKGLTFDALANACGIPAKSLVDSVERFNVFARQGRDEDFGRGNRLYDQWLGDASHTPSPALGTIEVPPFYALPIYPGDVSTFGGVVTDENARVIRRDGTPFDGLYATGASTASIMGTSYAGAGSSIGPTMTWGFIAGNDALSRNSSG